MGCGPGKKPRSKLGTSQGANPVEDQTLLSINETQLDLMRAVEKVVARKPGNPLAGLAKSRSEKMADAIKTGDKLNCDRSEWIYSDKQYALRVQGDYPACPIVLKKGWIYTKQNTWKFYHSFIAHNAEFREMIMLQSLEGKGTLRAREADGGTQVLGEIGYSNIVVSGSKQKSSLEVRSNLFFGEGEMTGSIGLRLQIGEQVTSASMSWSEASDEPIYLINGQSVAQKTFDERFSAFDFSEIVDRSRDLR